MKILDRLEKLIERLIEGPFNRLFKTHLHPADLARTLAAAMEQKQISDGQGGYLAPSGYQIALNGDDYQFLRQKSDMPAEIAALKRYLSGLLAETGGRTAGELQVSIHSQAGIERGQIEIRTSKI